MRERKETDGARERQESGKQWVGKDNKSGTDRRGKLFLNRVSRPKTHSFVDVFSESPSIEAVVSLPFPLFFLVVKAVLLLLVLPTAVGVQGG